MPRAVPAAMVVLLALPLTAGIAVLFGPAPASFAITLLAAPLGLLTTAILLRIAGRDAATEVWARRLFAGAFAGIVATIVYDLWRVGVRDVWGVPYDPFRVQPVFGRILTGLPSTHLLTLAAGWAHHLWLGALSGMIFAAIQPHGGALAGVAFAAVMQIGRWTMYPSVFGAGLADSEFVANGVLGQILWGLVIGVVVVKITAFSARNDAT